MVIPFIAAVMRDVFEVVPSVLKESAYALGSTTWEVVWNVVLPYTKVGVVGGVMLGLGRALGETMAVTFVIGNAHKLNPSLMMPGNSIASALANEFTEAVADLYGPALSERDRRNLDHARKGDSARDAHRHDGRHLSRRIRRPRLARPGDALHQRYPAFGPLDRGRPFRL